MEACILPLALLDVEMVLLLLPYRGNEKGSSRCGPIHSLVLPSLQNHESNKQLFIRNLGFSMTRVHQNMVLKT